MTRSRRLRFWIGGILLAFGLICIAVFVFNGPGSLPPRPPVPDSNGYDDFAAAAKLRANGPRVDVPMPKDKDFSLLVARQYVADSRGVIERVEAGLAKQAVVPIDFTTNWFDNHVNTYPELKKLEWLITLDGYVSEQDGKLHEAAKSYVDGLKFGSAVARGGLLIDCLISIADERIAISYLEGVVSKLDAGDCRFVMRELESWKTNREPFEWAAEREKKWVNVFGRMQYGSVRLMLEEISGMIAAKSIHPEAAVIAKTKGKYEAVVDQVETLKVRVAARMFELEHKSPPKGWGDLVPAYLPEIPIDIKTKRVMLFSF